jgi:hypothetical protein
MDTKLYLTIAAVVAILYALGFLLIPVEASLFFSGFAEPRAILNMRFCGAAVLAWGLIVWFARDFRDWAAVRGVLIASVVGLAVQLAVEPQAAVGKDHDEPPVATGLPRTWDEIAAGHLVIAQETLDYGWWEAIVIARNGDMLTLRFRDYPKLPKFFRHRNAIALMSPPAE